jgi:hypothetical protein
MSRKVTMILSVLALSLLLAVPAFAEGPSFEPAIYADGVAWSTKGLGALPAPNDQMKQSFDTLYLIEGQAMPVSEAGPGNPAYNGGRWATQAAMWTEEALIQYGDDLPVLTRFGPVDDPVSILFYLEIGDLVLIDSTPSYFECPLLPVK